MDYQALHKQIREKSLARVYLLHGEEEYVKERMWESLRACAVPETLPELNEHILNAPDASQIVAAAETLPVMAEHKLVAVHDYALLSGGRPKEEAAQLKALEACFARMQSDTCLVFFQRVIMHRHQLMFRHHRQRGAKASPSTSRRSRPWPITRGRW